MAVTKLRKLHKIALWEFLCKPPVIFYAINVESSFADAVNKNVREYILNVLDILEYTIHKVLSDLSSQTFWDCMITHYSTGNTVKSSTIMSTSLVIIGPLPQIVVANLMCSHPPKHFVVKSM